VEQVRRGARIFDWLWLLFWGVVSSAWCVTAAGQLSATFDEPLYVHLGLDGWRTGSHGALLRLGTMPLPVDVQTLPLYVFERWQGIQLDPVGNLDQLLPWARAATLVFWWLLLIYGRLAGRQLGGPWGGRLAVALLACEPSLLAHASLATTDIAVSACLLALVYHFRVGRRAGWWRRLALPMFWYAAAVSAKASALVFGPLCMLVVELCVVDNPWNVLGSLCRLPFWKRRGAAVPGPGSNSRRDLVWIVTGGLVLVFVYCGSDWKPEASFVRWAQQLPAGPFGQSMVWTADHLRVFSNAGHALARQVSHNVRGHGVYLLGRTDPRSLWYYFPVVLSIKLSLPLLLGPVILAGVRPRALVNWGCLTAAVLVVFSLTCRVQLGVRLMLPLVVLLIIGAAAAAVQAIRGCQAAWSKGLLRGGATAAVLWTAGTAALVWPHGLSYVNELWGGTERGYRLVSEANYDWGQGLKELCRWERRQGWGDLDVWYYGSDPTLTKLPLHNLPLHALAVERPEDLQPILRGHRLAVSTTLLYGACPTSRAQECARDFLLAHQAVARTLTFFIYDFTDESAASRHAVGVGDQ
jgi:hypothetical protein